MLLLNRLLFIQIQAADIIKEFGRAPSDAPLGTPFHLLPPPPYSTPYHSLPHIVSMACIIGVDR
jgi:hypothetical protein